MNCRRCGEILNANANFCWSCGAPQHETTSEATIAMPVLGSASEVAPGTDKGPRVRGVDELVIVTGPQSVEHFALDQVEMTVGRDEHLPLVLDDVSVSRRHAIFTKTASGRVTLRDLNSLNGTYVNGVRVDEVVLHSADEVQVGKYKMVFWGASS
ncbi:MAG: FHA domain-containing protein [Acidimicrobiaceae bacterium]|nr:FHA domain-containing protein [Acidimicrobiaceae bacterium]